MLSSVAFAEHGLIPINYSCAGANASPPLAWHGVAPTGTAEWALVVEDITVKPTPWVHWVITGISTDTRSSATGRPPAGAVVGRSGNGTTGFVGLCPPIGKVHQYRFTVYALNKAVALNPSDPTADALRQVKAASISSVSLTGRFGR
jgi:Raf kinase inhibitor-like YbhB/YbcL family protein